VGQYSFLSEVTKDNQQPCFKMTDANFSGGVGKCTSPWQLVNAALFKTDNQ
jgi:hypothetical protein